MSAPPRVVPALYDTRLGKEYRTRRRTHGARRWRMAIEREAVGRMEVIRYETPSLDGSPKRSANIARSDLLTVNMQVVSRDGGETNLHAHSAQDAVWFVLAGRARFYGKDGESVELGPKDALFIPKGTPYWFESVSDEPLEIMRNAATDPAIKNQRVNYEALRERQQDGRHAGSVYVNS
ncbi:MAG: cupin domain-containing protein [Chloroflexi bacterium]|nr:cupin domain-containing protein [Chloroflexota bacterium]MYA51207.1 cupin domain-containing protein [Chloroflexota bacterium]MYB83638.1 cupin domain-containing protein [Chloroflexota bacterium]MYK33727.1 cupin domain-containing protein [Chloroflexota bacterium]